MPIWWCITADNLRAARAEFNPHVFHMQRRRHRALRAGSGSSALPLPADAAAHSIPDRHPSASMTASAWMYRPSRPSPRPTRRGTFFLSDPFARAMWMRPLWPPCPTMHLLGRKQVPGCRPTSNPWMWPSFPTRPWSSPATSSRSNSLSIGGVECRCIEQAAGIEHYGRHHDR